MNFVTSFFVYSFIGWSALIVSTINQIIFNGNIFFYIFFPTNMNIRHIFAVKKNHFTDVIRIVHRYRRISTVLNPPPPRSFINIDDNNHGKQTKKLHYRLFITHDSCLCVFRTHNIVLTSHLYCDHEKLSKHDHLLCTLP